MKSLWTCIILLMIENPGYQHENKITNPQPIAPVRNLFIITIDGFRWQELFKGADSILINDEKITPDGATIKLLYWASTAKERRKRLMPFFWNVLASKGQLFGNRGFGNKINVDNIFSISYPGYNEIFTGKADITISSNSRNPNRNVNILEYLNSKEEFKDSIAVFTSWNAFPFILNKERSGIIMNCGYEDLDQAEGSLLNKMQNEIVDSKTSTRYDQLTFLAAKEYTRKHLPRVLYIGLGETDEFAHQKRYDLYLQQATEIDRMIAELWHWVQTTPGYKNNTTLVITTDHGRGQKKGNWFKHGAFIKGSSQTWLAMIGPGIKPLGEIKENNQLYQKQIAETIALLLGEDFATDQLTAPALSLK